jgi:hypothetical protein
MIRSLMLVLDGNIPRFPWEPSTTMLTYRLGRHYRGFGVLPGRTAPVSQHEGVVAQALAATGERPTKSSLTPASPKALYVADLHVRHVRVQIQPVQALQVQHDMVVEKVTHPHRACHGTTPRREAGSDRCPAAKTLRHTTDSSHPWRSEAGLTG